MASFVIEGGQRLHGEITPQGAKNEVLQVLCAVLLTAEEVVVNNVPDILDVNNLIQLLRDMGVKVAKLGLSTYSFKADRVDLDYLQSDLYTIILFFKGEELVFNFFWHTIRITDFGNRFILSPSGEVFRI